MSDANKPSAPLFGAPASGGSMFGNQGGKSTTFPFGGPSSFGASQAAASTTPQSSPSKPTPAQSFSFSPAAFSSNAGGTSNANTTTSSSLFGGGGNTLGAAPSAPKPLFGNTNTGLAGTASSTTSNLFGSNANSNTSNIFGGGMTVAGSSSNTNQTTTAASAAKPSLFGGAPSNPTAGTNLSGNPTPTNTGIAPASNTTGSSFAFGAPAANQPPKDANTPGSIFGGAQAPKPAATTTGSLFGAKPAEATSNPTPLFGNNLTPAGTSTSTATTAAPPSSSLFSSNTLKANPASELPAKSPATLFGNMNSGLASKSTAPVKSSPLAMGSSTTTTAGEGSSQQTANKPATSFSSAIKTAAGTPPATPSTTKPNINLAPSLLKGKTLEDLVARWNSELDERVEDFKHTANEIAAWDQVLIQNGDQISMLYEELQQIEPIQNSIDQTLDYVETQQQELSAALEDYERQLSSSNQAQDFSTTSSGRTRTAAQEREEAYKTAEEVHVQLNDMASSLGTMIAELNSLAGPGNKIDESSALTEGGIPSGSSSTSNEDPIVQIAGILNAHLGSLNWIGEITQELGTKVNELESRVSNTKVEFGLESNLANNHHNHRQQIEFNNSDESNHHNSLSNVGLNNGSNLHSGFGNSRVHNGLSPYPRR
ncbi:hypothetical protein MJO28_000990 [Puccinia striiformis f. sp. tritici]|uniref:Nucleoporin NSP1 n=3 Tax=Puccinia striiformis TaxID=27350 RepID=A0A0L0VRI3_9BASI|nr:hypothetical protein Pst134EB_001486 [Puccinia striiformis f. sp. tritici]KAI9601492.1 hypothetical protein H4Q26_001312 [Puccinia striiformis f. sp. tritici PST-130]KNF01879.1 hypothetical protein PSTG_04996 [Puccinia striiformis f. sp. tritici PST-78]POW18509.1 hypothetical protein PSHT_05709 [Puccinia striiformis]KAI7962896.1 hypothetical protein MJO28_000990 [Puccinia striiformis f. sp. tritici]